jgi:pimeloyl-ACP methyl ester carboxylesterase
MAKTSRRIMERNAESAEVNGASLRYEVEGSGEPLVLIHAGICDRRMWETQREAFAERYRVILYDRRGFGETRIAERRPFSNHEDLRGLLDHLGVDSALLLGCSIGSMTALDFALEYPERVRALVLVAPGVGGFDPGGEPPEELEELIAADEAGDLETVNELEVRMWVDGPYRTPDEVEPGVRDLVREMNLIALQNEASLEGDERPLQPPAAQRLSEVQVPTLIIAGDLDQPETAVTAAMLEESVRGSRRVVLPGTAHLPNMERPAEFNKIVLRFLESLES